MVGKSAWLGSPSMAFKQGRRLTKWEDVAKRVTKSDTLNQTGSYSQNNKKVSFINVS